MAKTDQEKRDDELSVAITRVLYPVITCMVLAVVLIRLVEPKDRNCLNKRPQGDILTAFPSASSSSSSTENIYEGLGGVIFIIIFFSCMVLFTFALMYLYKKGYVKAIQAWLLFSVLLIFAYVGGVYLYELCRSRCIDLDWITLVFITWNFSITGMIAVFGTVPRLVNQGYLVVMSALMAYIFRRLPEWATWIILGLLVLWDLFAVLTPCGPLRKLVEMARERGDPLPALVYDTNPAAVGRDDEAQPAVQWKSREQRRRLRGMLRRLRFCVSCLVGRTICPIVMLGIFSVRCARSDCGLIYPCPAPLGIRGLVWLTIALCSCPCLMPFAFLSCRGEKRSKRAQYRDS